MIANLLANFYLYCSMISRYNELIYARMRFDWNIDSLATMSWWHWLVWSLLLSHLFNSGCLCQKLCRNKFYTVSEFNLLHRCLNTGFHLQLRFLSNDTASSVVTSVVLSAFASIMVTCPAMCFLWAFFWSSKHSFPTLIRFYCMAANQVCLSGT